MNSRRFIRSSSQLEETSAEFRSRWSSHSVRVQILRRKRGAWRRTAMGQSRHFDRLPETSGLPQSTDINRAARLIRFVPTVLKKSFSPDKRKIPGPLMRFARWRRDKTQ
jgi:hypothetical protein